MTARLMIPKRTPKWLMFIICPVLCSLHGFHYGILYAPAQALMFGLNFREMLAWIVTGLPFDLVHGVSNLAVGMLILPPSELLSGLMRRSHFA